jgi:hypothetical protein
MQLIVFGSSIPAYLPRGMEVVVAAEEVAVAVKVVVRVWDLAQGLEREVALERVVEADFLQLRFQRRGVRSLRLVQTGSVP